MRALLLDGHPRTTHDHPLPERPPGAARIAMDLAGVCDTDLQLVQGYLGFRGVLGHEFVGRVLEADARDWVGRRVVADINAGCGECSECQQRGGHHCASRSVLGIAGRDGAFAEQLVMPEACLIAVPDSVPNDQAVFAEPLAAAQHVLDDEAVASAANVVVLGDGKLGLLAALVVAASGKATTLVGRHARKLAIAERAGVRTVLVGSAPTSLHTLPRSEVVIEATGSARGLKQALELVQPRGTVVAKTTVADRTEIDLAPLVVNEVRLVGSRCGDLGRAVRLLEEGKVDPRPLIDARYPLAEATAALEHAARRGTLKVLIEGSSTAP